MYAWPTNLDLWHYRLKIRQFPDEHEGSAPPGYQAYLHAAHCLSSPGVIQPKLWAWCGLSEWGLAVEARALSCLNVFAGGFEAMADGFRCLCCAVERMEPSGT